MVRRPAEAEQAARTNESFEKSVRRAGGAKTVDTGK